MFMIMHAMHVMHDMHFMHIMHFMHVMQYAQCYMHNAMHDAILYMMQYYA